MRFSTDLTSLKKAAVVATFIAVVAGITTESAYARRGSGVNIQNYTGEFDFSTSAAIENFILCYDRPENECNNTNADVGSTFGTVVTTDRITTPSDPNTSILSGSDFTEYTFDDLIKDPNTDTDFEKDGFNEAVLKYEIELDNPDNRGNSDKLFLFLPSTGDIGLDNQLLASLSNVDKFSEITQIHGIYQGDLPPREGFDEQIDAVDAFGFNDSVPFQLEPTTHTAEVPEPSATAGLLAVSVLGAVFMVKRKRYKNLF